MAFRRCWWTACSQRRRQPNTARRVWMAKRINRSPNRASHHRRAWIYRMWPPEAPGRQICQITNNIALWLHLDICKMERNQVSTWQVRPKIDFCALTWHRWTAVRWTERRIAFRRPSTTSSSDTNRAHWTNSECRARCATNISCMWHRSDRAPRTEMFPPDRWSRPRSIQPQSSTVASICKRIGKVGQIVERRPIVLCVFDLPDVSIHELLAE